MENGNMEARKVDPRRLIDTLRVEITENERAVRALKSEARRLRIKLFVSKASLRRILLRSTLRPEQTVEELREKLSWASSLLKMLSVESRAAKFEMEERIQELEKMPRPRDTGHYNLQKQAHQKTISQRASRLSKRGIQVLASEGIGAFLYKTACRIHRKLVAKSGFIRAAGWLAIMRFLESKPAIFRLDKVGLGECYREWIEANEPTLNETSEQRGVRFPIEPLISIAMPTYNTPIPFLLATIESVRSQSYANWELCIADGGSANSLVQKVLKYYSERDNRIKIKLLSENLGIAGNSNAALDMAQGEFITLLDHDDALPPFALFEIVNAINLHPDGDFFYSDEDKISREGWHRFDPHFKSAWAPDTLRSVNYICHLIAANKKLIEKVGGFRTGFDGSQDYDLVLRCTEQANQIVHIPKVLYHWRSHSGSVAGSVDAKPYAGEAAKKAIREHLSRCQIDGSVQRDGANDCYRIVHRMPRRPFVSMIIPNKDHADVLRVCLESIAHSTYKNYEIVIVENNSRDPETFAYYAEVSKDPAVRIVPWNRPFNYAAATNFGVQHSSGEMLLFLNNDMEVINRDWLESLLEHAVRNDVGAVGAKLYYPNGAIQHGGVVIGLGGIAGHIGVAFPPNDSGYMRRLQMVHNLSAVTAACLMTPRTAYHKVGGLDERFVLAFNDIDYCLKLRQQDYLVIWTPYSELYHFESLSRGFEDTPEKQARFQSEINLFVEKWSDVLDSGDPFYSPNLSLEYHDWSIRSTTALSSVPRATRLRGLNQTRAA